MLQHGLLKPVSEFLGPSMPLSPRLFSEKGYPGIQLLFCLNLQNCGPLLCDPTSAVLCPVQKDMVESNWTLSNLRQTGDAFICKGGRLSSWKRPSSINLAEAGTKARPFALRIGRWHLLCSIDASSICLSFSVPQIRYCKAAKRQHFLHSLVKDK